MTHKRSRTGRRGLAVLCATILAVGAAGSVRSSAASKPAKKVTINWWHIQNADPMLSVWAGIAKDYQKLHPNVTIKITVMENEAFKAALKTNMQSGKVPDLFQSWGGGVLREQVKAKLVRDITKESAKFIGNLNAGAVGLQRVDGKLYGVPFNSGMVGFWYNKDLFAKAGITAPPTTWDEFLADVAKLKAAGITPIAVGAGDKWPAHFYYSYLMIRFGGKAAMDKVTKDGNFNVPAFIKAGDELKKLIDLKPFQSGFLATPWDGADGEAGFMATGKAAMDLMGQWAPGAFANQTPNQAGMGDKLGWFPFPAVTGGAGQATDAFGGSDAFAVGKNAPAEAVDFLGYLTAVDQAKKAGATNSILPVTKGADVSVADPNQKAVLSGLSKAGFVQLYLDQYFSPAVGSAVNDAVQSLFAGKSSSADVANAITAAYKANP